MTNVRKIPRAQSVRTATQSGSVSDLTPVALTIAGHRLSIRTDKDEAYLRELAEYVDGIVQQLQTNARHVGSHQVLLLAALNLADELFAALDRTEDLKAAVQARTEHLIRMLDDGSESGESP